MNIPEEHQNPLTEYPGVELPDLSILNKDLHTSVKNGPQSSYWNPINAKRPLIPLLTDSEEIGVLEQQVHITKEDMAALTAHPRKWSVVKYIGHNADKWTGNIPAPLKRYACADKVYALYVSHAGVRDHLRRLGSGDGV